MRAPQSPSARPHSAGWSWAVPILLLVAPVAACDSPGDDAGSTGGTGTSDTEVICAIGDIPADRERGEPSEPALRLELLEMQDADQAERTGEVLADNDARRTDRLREIIDEYGWLTPDLVGDDGATAAWLIAQHTDFDVEFQREVLDLMCAALATGDADPTEVAYLEDRVAVNSGRPQIYATQVGGCEDGKAVPKPLADEQRVHQRREQVGLGPLDEYLAFFDEGCATTAG